MHRWSAYLYDKEQQWLEIRETALLLGKRVQRALVQLWMWMTCSISEPTAILNRLAGQTRASCAQRLAHSFSMHVLKGSQAVCREACWALMLSPQPTSDKGGRCSKKSGSGEHTRGKVFQISDLSFLASVQLGPSQEWLIPGNWPLHLTSPKGPPDSGSSQCMQP
jgi:hypothetical protein